jgi:SAM-dependent methyltransferase
MDAALRDVREKRLLIDEQDRWLVDRFHRYLGPRLLEVGCGWGNILRLVEASVQEIVAIDLDPESVEHVRDLYRSRPDFVALVGDICDPATVEAVGGGFDTVLSINVLEHVQDDLLALTHMKRVLAPGGHLVAVVPAHARIHNRMDRAIGHYRRYSKADMAAKLTHIGCEVVTLSYINPLGALGWLINGRLLGRTTPPAGQLKLMNAIVPVLRRLEALGEPPFGISLLAVAR